jgi:hypothetical protein
MGDRLGIPGALGIIFCQFLENSNILIIRFAIAIPILFHNIDLNFRSNNKHFLKSDKALEELLIVGFYKLETESKIYESACNFLKIMYGCGKSTLIN